jgi:hypothetical protein
MATRASKSRFTNADLARVEQAGQLAGITAAFGQGADLWVQAVQLQKSLLGGVVRAQQREAERLAALHAKGDPRIKRASEGAQRLQELHAEVNARAQEVERFAAASQRAGTFYGYVVQPDGAPAEAYTVQIKVKEDTSKPARQGTAKTDATGYFRIDLESADQPGGALQIIFDRLARGAKDAAPGGGQPPGTPGGGQPPGAPAADDSKPGPEQSAETTAASTVVVSDPSGNVVLEDPIPPTFEGGSSEFRYYVLPEKSTVRPKTKAKR